MIKKKPTIKDNTSSLNISNLSNKSTQINKETDEIENLKSVLYQIEYLNEMLEVTYEKQRHICEGVFNEKIHELIKLRETNFSLHSRIINMSNIIKIEEYFTVNYNKLLNLEPKISNLLENIDDLKANINYGLDRLYLEENVVSDDKLLKEYFEMSKQSLEILISTNEEKFSEIEEIKKNYCIFINLIEEEKDKLSRVKELFEQYKDDVYNTNIAHISKMINLENRKLEEDLFN